jgi:hypothetical protein
LKKIIDSVKSSSIQSYHDENKLPMFPGRLNVIDKYLGSDDFVDTPMQTTPTTPQSVARRASIHMSVQADPVPQPKSATYNNAERLSGQKIHMYLADDDFETSSNYEDFIKSPMVEMIIDPVDEPYEKYFTLCQLKGDETQYVLPGVTENVKGVTHRNDRLVILFENGEIWSSKPNQGYTPIKSEIHMDDITTFNNIIRGHSDGIMYTMTNIINGHAKWIVESNAPENIRHWSTTQDGNYLWIQDANEGFLYDRRMNLISQEPISDIRIYGDSKDIHVNINQNSGKGLLSFDSTTITDIFDGTFTDEGLVKITASQRRSGTILVKNINGTVYYIASKSVGV